MERNIAGLLFADDAVIFSESKNEMILALDKIKAWCDRWKMNININKCGYMVANTDNEENIE